LNVFKDKGLTDIISAALTAAKNRAEELGRKE
jgi:hypothetical protein